MAAIKYLLIDLLIATALMLSGCTLAGYDPKDYTNTGKTHAQLKQENYDFLERNPYIPFSGIMEGIKQFND